MKKNRKTVIDLFCGCGGLSYGFIEAGCEVVLGIDHWKDAIETFKYAAIDPVALLAITSWSSDWLGFWFLNCFCKKFLTDVLRPLKLKLYDPSWSIDRGKSYAFGLPDCAKESIFCPAG